jgi:chromosome segregation ATPase
MLEGTAVEPRDITNEILIGIRDEIRLTNAEVRQNNARLDGHERIFMRVADELGHLTGRVDHLTGRVEALGGEMAQVNARLDRHDARFAGITEILTRMDRRLEHVEGTIDRAFDVAANPAFVDLQRRVEALEHKTG